MAFLPTAANYRFNGDPVYGAMAAANHKADRAAQGQIGAANAQAAGMAGAARQQALGSLYEQPTNAYTAYAGANAQGAGAYQQGLGALASAQSGLYQNYNTALANLYGSQMANMGQTESARQIGLANLGSSALSAGGQAAGAAMGAWGQNQSSFAKAMSDAAAANQAATAQYGVGRDTSLAALGNAASNYGIGLNTAWTTAQGNANNYSRDLNKLGVARDLGIGQLGVGSQVAGNMPASYSGIGNALGGIAATANGSPMASGSYDSAPSYGTAPAARLPGYGWSPTQYTEQPGDAALMGLAQGSRDTFGSIADSRRAIEGSGVLESLNANNAATRNQLDSAYYSSRNMPSQMLAQSMGGFNQMLNNSSSGLNAGMDQFYANIPRDGADRMREGMLTGSQALGGLAGQMGSAYTNMANNNQSGYGAAQKQLQDVMNRTGVMTDIDRQRQDFQSQDERRAMLERRRASGMQSVADARAQWFRDNPAKAGYYGRG